jgi:hypothetical protein
MSLDYDVITAMDLGDILELPCLLDALPMDEPLLLCLTSAKPAIGQYLFNMTFAGIILGSLLVNTNEDGTIKTEVL